MTRPLSRDEMDARMAQLARRIREPEILEGYGWDGAYREAGANGIADVTGVEVEGGGKPVTNNAGCMVVARRQAECPEPVPWGAGRNRGPAFLLSALSNAITAIGLVVMGVMT